MPIGQGQPSQSRRRRQAESYDDYLSTWSKVATSKAQDHSVPASTIGTRSFMRLVVARSSADCRRAVSSRLPGINQTNRVVQQEIHSAPAAVVRPHAMLSSSAAQDAGNTSAGGGRPPQPRNGRRAANGPVVVIPKQRIGHKSHSNVNGSIPPLLQTMAQQYTTQSTRAEIKPRQVQDKRASSRPERRKRNLESGGANDIQVAYTGNGDTSVPPKYDPMESPVRKRQQHESNIDPSTKQMLPASDANVDKVFTAEIGSTKAFRSSVLEEMRLQSHRQAVRLPTISSTSGRPSNVCVSSSKELDASSTSTRPSHPTICKSEADQLEPASDALPSSRTANLDDEEQLFNWGTHVGKGHTALEQDWP